eukprot:11734214-Alexandrium_andersonii.AAC.1
MQRRLEGGSAPSAVLAQLARLKEQNDPGANLGGTRSSDFGARRVLGSDFLAALDVPTGVRSS